MPYGSVDLRLSKSPSHAYYLKEGQTFSFRESPPGTRTNTWLDMTAWDSSPYQEGNLREKDATGDRFVMNYRFLVPQGYDENYSPGYPLILIMHGLGERANCWDEFCYHADQAYDPLTNDPPAPTDSDHRLLNNDHQLSNGGAVHLAARNRAGTKLPDDESLHERAFPGFILVPQNLNGWDIKSVQDALRLVRLFIKKYNIDEDRVYIHGLSNGGQGVYEAIKRAPWMFAGALTMSAISDANIIAQNMTGAIAHIPLWAFQGGQDINPYPQKTENYIRQFRDAGMVVRYKRYEELGHGTWNTAYNEPDFFSWILGRNRAHIHTDAGNPIICGSSGAPLRMPEGFFAYQWEFNGSVIEGANTATYVATQPGRYRGRFSRVPDPGSADWNQWSPPVEVKQGDALPKADIAQLGTVILKDLNGNGNAFLKAVGTYDQYYWYKDGKLIDFPGTQDDTISHPIITPSMGNGAYTLITSRFGNCRSPASSPVHIFFNNSAPANITAPADLTGKVSGPHVTLTWTDRSSNEGGFEIWRRMKNSSGNFSPWQLAVLTAPNTTRYEDIGLFPTTVYEYKIRAVSTTGRSEYFPATGAVAVETETDEEPPTTPENFKAVITGVQRAKLSWSPSTDNAHLRDYLIEFDGTTIATQSVDTVFVINDLPLNRWLSLTVKARDAAGNLSEPSNPSSVVTQMAGLFYQHSTGFVETLDSVNWDIAEFTGVVLDFTLEPKTQDDYFNFRFDGFLYIEQGGTYQFRTISDDGSRLYLDGQRIINNDGIHDINAVESNNRQLQAGAHRITVDFFDYIETDSLGVHYKGPDTNNEWAEITINVLKSADSVITSIPPEQRSNPMILSVFPNPSHASNINVKVESQTASPVLIQMLDPMGRRILAEEFDAEEAAFGVTLSPPNALARGVYIIIATQDQAEQRARVIIRE